MLRRLSTRETESKPLDHWIALFYLGALILAELKTPEVISPLMSVLAFGFFALRMKPRFVVLWSLPYTAVSYYYLLQDGSTSEDRATAYIRCGTLLLAVIGAVLLSRNRSRVAESFLQTLTILEKLPVPVVLSDASGCIVFMNDDALKLLEVTPEEVLGSSYFTFMAEGERGRAIQQYLDMVDSKQCQLAGVVVQIKKPFPREITASIVSIQAEHVKLLATVLRPDRDEGQTEGSLIGRGEPALSGGEGS